MEVDENCERLQTGVSFVHHSFLTISILLDADAFFVCNVTRFTMQRNDDKQ